MRYSRNGDSFIVRLETGEEIVSSLSSLATGLKVDLAMVSGIGAASHVVLGYYDRSARDYVRREVGEDVEIVSLVGNIALKDGRAFPHLHVTLGDRDFRVVAGHLFEGKVSATCEIIIRPLSGTILRRQDEATGLYLLDV